MSHYCILGPDNLFSIFKHPQIERSFAPRGTVPTASPIFDLDDTDDEIWDFGADETSMTFWT